MKTSDLNQEFVPPSATHKFTQAKQHERIYYRKLDNKWWSYSPVFHRWYISNNDARWFRSQIIQGYFVSIDHTEESTIQMSLDTDSSNS
jgi:hypothetical protein